MDVCYATIGYYTGPISSELGKNLVNARLDAFTDIAETYLFSNVSSSAPVKNYPKWGVIASKVISQVYG